MQSFLYIRSDFNLTPFLSSSLRCVGKPWVATNALSPFTFPGEQESSALAWQASCSPEERERGACHSLWQGMDRADGVTAEQLKDDLFSRAYCLCCSWVTWYSLKSYKLFRGRPRSARRAWCHALSHPAVPWSPLVDLLSFSGSSLCLLSHVWISSAAALWMWGRATASMKRRGREVSSCFFAALPLLTSSAAAPVWHLRFGARGFSYPISFYSYYWVDLSPEKLSVAVRFRLGRVINRSCSCLGVCGFTITFPSPPPHMQAHIHTHVCSLLPDLQRSLTVFFVVFFFLPLFLSTFPCVCHRVTSAVTKRVFCLTLKSAVPPAAARLPLGLCTQSMKKSAVWVNFGQGVHLG